MPSYSDALKTGGNAAGAIGGGIAGIAGGIQANTKAANVAAQSIFTASSAANAIPVAGQFVSAGLAIAGLFVKIFAGRKKKRREEREAAQRKKTAQASDAVKAGTQSGGSAGVGTGQEGAGAAVAGSVAPVSGPAAPSFSSWGGGSAPSVQPVQQALNNKIGV
jgi:hypothetical protein